MNNNPIGWPDSAFGYNASTQTLTAPTVAATKTVTVNAPSSYTGNLLNLQIGGVNKFSVTNAGRLLGASSNVYLDISDTLGTQIGYGATNYLRVDSTGIYPYAPFYGFHGPSGLTFIYNEANNVWAQRNSANAQTCRVYNTYTSSTNYERGKLEWSGNVFNVGTEKGSGGGTARSMALQTDATDRLTLDTVGSVRVTTGLTVATLPASPTVGMIARVTNALSPTIGSTVAGGGAANALCWYNGTNWTVLGI